MTASVLVPLLGVVIGAVGALLGQGLANRVSARQANAARAVAIRAERKDAIVSFLEAAQAAEQIATQIPKDTVRAGMDARMHDVWFRQKCVELTCTSPVRSAAWNYAQRLSDAVYNGASEGVDVYQYLSQRRGPFLVVARTELGIAEVLTLPAR